MKSIWKLYILILLCSIAFSGCTDIVQVDLPPATPQLSVDGWLYNDTSYQEIKLTYTTAYFDSTPQPAITNAKIFVTDLTGFQLYPMTQAAGKPGIYCNSKLKPILGHKYQLDIYHDFEHYVASDQVNRVPQIDSLVFTLRNKDTFRKDATWELTLFARDLPGVGDNYKFNVIKNGQLLNTSDDINITEDRSADGLTFIPPINRRLNRLTYKENIDTITVRIMSLSPTSFAFWSTVQNALNNRGLFARPANNVLSNIINVNPYSPTKAVGYFGCSGVSYKTRIVGQKQK
jgi:hypothetical protein